MGHPAPNSAQDDNFIPPIPHRTRNGWGTRQRLRFWLRQNDDLWGLRQNDDTSHPLATDN